MRYHAYKDGASGPKKILALIYLLWLNFGYYVLRIRQYGEIETGGQGGEILITDENGKASVDDCVTKLSAYDVISFDIFDTLIFRPFDEPTELFNVLGQELGISDFRRLRTNAEYQARVKKKKEAGHMEVSLAEIWQELEAEAGAAAVCVETDFAVYGAQAEMDLEEKLCFADPFMLNVWRRLKEQDKEIIVISDMYLPGAFLEKMLEKNGFTGFAKLYVSNEWERSKAAGNLFRLVRRQLETDVLSQGTKSDAETITTSPAQESKDSSTQEFISRNKLRLIHIGDNVISDWQMARKNGFESRLYQKKEHQ